MAWGLAMNGKQVALSFILLVSPVGAPLAYQLLLGWMPIGPRGAFVSPRVPDYLVGMRGFVAGGELCMGNYTFRLVRTGIFDLPGDPRLYELHLTFSLVSLVRETEYVVTIENITCVRHWKLEPMVYISFNGKRVVLGPLDALVIAGPGNSLFNYHCTIVLHHYADSLRPGENEVNVTVLLKVRAPARISLNCLLLDLGGVVTLHDRDGDLIADCIIDVIPVNNFLLGVALASLYLLVALYRLRARGKA